MSRPEVEPFTDQQIDLVTVFADQAVIAIENARLVGELRDWLAALATSVEDLEGAGRNRSCGQQFADLSPCFLDLIAERVMTLCQADACAMFAMNGSDRQSSLWRASGLENEFAKQITSIYNLGGGDRDGNRHRAADGDLD